MQSIDQKTYLAVVAQKLYAIRKLTKDLQRALPSPASEEFIRALSLITDGVETFLLFRVNYLKTTLAGNPTELEVQIAFNARVALRILGAIHQQYLPLLHAGSRHNEYLVYPSIDRAVQVFASDFELTLVPDFDYNYAFVGIESFALREIEKLEKHSDQATQAALGGVKNDAAAIKRWITFLHFPMADRDSALNLCILAHELAHLVDKTNQIYEQLVPKELDKGSFEKLIVARKSATVPTGPGGPQLTMGALFTDAWFESQCYLACTQMLENWVREIIADILAIHAIGPACYFAFNDFFAYMGSENRPSKTHPPAAFRLLLMLDELKDLGYMNSSGAVNSALTAGLGRVASDAAQLKYNEEAEVVQKTIQTNLTDLLAKIRDFISKHSFRAPMYQDSVPTVLKRLKAGIAPIEFYDEKSDAMRPASVRAILNAGWELYETDLIGFYANFKGGGQDLEKLDNLNQLLFKAVEASEVKRQWK